MRILVVEDEKHIASFIKQGLKEEGYSVDVAYDGEEGYFLGGTEEYDAIVLDLMLPKMDGLTVCKKLREDKINTPIIILTARGNVDDKIAGLDSGAEDYLTKPFAFKELLARIRVLLRKDASAISTKLQVDDLVMDVSTHKVTRNKKEIPLTMKEFSLLEYLMQYRGQAVARTELSEHVWDINFNRMTNVVDVHINALRKKIDRGHKKKLIHTIRGRGYVIKG